MSLDLQNFFTDKHNVCKLTKYIFYEKVNTQTSSHSEPQKALTLFNKAQWQGRDIYTSDQEAHRKMLYIYIIYVIYIYIYSSGSRQRSDDSLYFLLNSILNVAQCVCLTILR